RHGGVREARARFVPMDLLEEARIAERSKELIAALEDRAKVRLGFEQLPAHPRPLRSLARENEGEASRRARAYGTRVEAQLRRTGEEGFERIRKRGARALGDREPMRMMSPIHRSGAEEIVERERGIGPELRLVRSGERT